MSPSGFSCCYEMGKAGKSGLSVPNPSLILRQGGFQHMLLRPPSGTARSKLAINHHSRHATHAVALRLGRNVRLIHVVDYDLVVRSRKTLYGLDSFFAS